MYIRSRRAIFGLIEARLGIKGIIREETYGAIITFVVKINGEKYMLAFEASGIQKFILLYLLLKYSFIKRDSVLFWDEPENSLNPELVPELVGILLELSRSGVQIFIATHDYNFARYFDVRKDKNVPVMYHNLIKINEQIICHSSPEYIKLPDNLLEKAIADLFKAVVSDADMRKVRSLQKK
jgi:ABC-type histidine transport system ATPase subunit